MVSSNHEKRCSCYNKYKNLNEFTRLIGGQMKKCSNCNECVKTKKEKKKVISEPMSAESLNITKDYINDEYEDIAWFSLTDIVNLIANCFKSEEHNHAYFLKTLKFDKNFVNMHNKNQKSDKEVTYYNIAESLLVTIKIGFHYY
ncbi:2662_t:CDS:1 [Cetraspora pellucida]|uniref:2662_t:CDS:1 n=1 Tax=Cetraspora pellucida TaxID=1433469 RepID=A0A9N9P7U7_9GLOM|nr:2662_t:CDS:1 [Cetraspora pellucida]